MVVTLDTGLVNVFLLVGARTVLVDAGYPGSHTLILHKLRALGVSTSDVSLVVITHGHVDHFGGAAALKQHIRAPLLVHRADADCLREGRSATMRMRDDLSPLARETFLRKAHKLRTTPLTPDIVIDGEFDLRPFGVAAILTPTPGHSPGSVSVLLDDGRAIVADLVMETRTLPKRVSLPLFFDDLAQSKDSLRRVLARKPCLLLASHGGPFTPEEVEDMLEHRSADNPSVSTTGAQ